MSRDKVGDRGTVCVPGVVASWPSDSVERRSVGTLTEYARNTRTHTQEQIDAIAEAIKEWGWTNPVLIDEGGKIIAGHGRVMAARQMGLAEVPVMVARGWTEAQKRAYVIADNKLYERGGWDAEMLASEVLELSDLGANIDILGLSDKELAGIFPEIEDGDAEEKSIDTSDVNDVFWISVSGPLHCQASALSRLVDVMETIPGVQVELGTVRRDGLG